MVPEKKKAPSDPVPIPTQAEESPAADGGIEATMVQRMEVLARRGDVDTLLLYTDPYYSLTVRTAAVRALGRIDSGAAAEALLRLQRAADPDLKDEVAAAIREYMTRLDIGPLAGAAYLAARRQTGALLKSSRKRRCGAS